MSHHECNPNIGDRFTEAETIVYLVVGGLVTIACATISYIWLKRIHCFPIRERSPYMSFICLIFIWINTMLIPINLLVFYKIRSGIYEDDFYIRIMTFFSFSSVFGIFTNYIFRALRMTYVVATNYTIAWLDSMMKREVYLISLNLIISLLFGFIGAFVYDAKDVPFETVICLNDFEAYENQREITPWEIFIYVVQSIYEILLIFLVFGLKKIKPGYNIVKELVMMVFVMVVSNFVYYLLYHLLEKFIPINLILIRLNIVLRNLFFLYFSFIYTIIISHHGRAPTPTYIIFQELRYFLYDHTCVTVFHEFLKRVYPNQVNGFLFYLDFVSQRVSAKDLFIEYFQGKCKVDGVNAMILNRIKEDFDRNEEDFSHEQIIELRDVVYEGLELRFVNYKKTKSCKKLIDEFEYHDLITERLFAYNMESFNMQI